MAVVVCRKVVEFGPTAGTYHVLQTECMVHSCRQLKAPNDFLQLLLNSLVYIPCLIIDAAQYSRT